MRNVIITSAVIILMTITQTIAFQASLPHGRFATLPQTQSIASISSTSLYSSNKDDEQEDSIINRFLSPKMDDAGLPLADSLIAQIVAPSFQIFYLSIFHAPRPSWLAPLFNNNNGMLYQQAQYGTLVAPTLIHGAGLAACWIAGALAAKAYDSDAFNVSGGRGYGTVITRIVQAGAFSTGLLIFSTQIDLFLEFGRYVQPGESKEIDVRLLTAIVELINDVFFEAVALTSWRIYRASLTAKPEGRPDNYDPDE